MAGDEQTPPFDFGAFKDKHEHEQLRANLSQMASFLFGYFNALVGAGFERDDALLLTIRYQTSFLSNVGKKPPND